MRRNLGVSIYPDHSDVAQDKAYLRLANSYGFTRIFMSMLEVTEGKEAVKEKFQSLIHFSKELGYEVILDIAPNIFEELGISYDDLSFFAELGADGIRLDVGFDGNKEALLTYNPYGLAIELNMSNDVAYLDNILTYQANTPYLYGCHNFYPQENTALPYDFFVKCSERFKRAGLRTAAFISSQVATGGPWDINDGLPTLEMHRHLPVEVQAKHLFATNLIDDVVIGNAYASEEELKRLSEVNRYQLELEVALVEEISDVERKIVLEEQHVRRGDITSAMARSTEVRKKYKNEANPPHDNTQSLLQGDVVVGNDQFGKYKNELQVILEPHADERKNLVARVRKEELFLLEFLRPWSKFRFVVKS
ncbi:MAG: MupG family TIM beta-alpha barrel fold protein [Lactobacillales bacterium]|jgi:hypothetical protein|nr:MupG family TIM beta-alpha barrel fold protein [Lactobacillales bacterium]